jgi:chromosomal replication initiator protein
VPFSSTSATTWVAGPADAAELLLRLEEAIARRINQDRYNLWFRDHTRFVMRGDELLIGVPNLMCQDWLQNTFGDDVQSASNEILGDGFAVRFAIDPELFRAARAEQERIATETSQPEANGAIQAPVAAPKTGQPHRTKRHWRSLTDFVVGSCNRVAHASALSVVEEPGQGVNPLVVYGPVGTGKTHLLEGIYAGLRRRQPDLAVRFTTAEQFTNGFLQTMHEGKQVGFRARYRDCNVLLIDDLDFLAGKKATQIEFLHTFDALVADHHQIVITTDCHPRLTEDFLPELADRLLGGAVWSLLPPDSETRLALLRAKAGAGSPTIPEDVLSILAERLRGNVRELEGAVHSLRHFARVAGRPVDAGLAREALSELFRHSIRRVALKDVDAAVCSAVGLSVGSLQTKKRCWTISHPRMIAIYLSRKHTAATYGEISGHFGVKTHSTSVAAEKKVRQWLDGNTKLRIGDHEWTTRDLVDRIERELGR